MMRKVKISEYEDGSGNYTTNGYFHDWGKFAHVSDNGVFQVTLAIVELENGEIKIYNPNRLKFVNAF